MTHLAVAACGLMVVGTVWVFYEIDSMRSWVKHDHVRPRWRRLAASMGTFQLGVSVTIAAMNVQQGEGWGAAVSGSIATGMLGLGFWAYALLQPRWSRMFEMHDSPTP